MDWVNVKDALPEDGEWVLICTDLESIYFVPYSDGFNRTPGDDGKSELKNVKYWQRVYAPGTRILPPVIV